MPFYLTRKKERTRKLYKLIRQVASRHNASYLVSCLYVANQDVARLYNSSYDIKQRCVLANLFCSNHTVSNVVTLDAKRPASTYRLPTDDAF